jgi:hypothetical protein
MMALTLVQYQGSADECVVANTPTIPTILLDKVIDTENLSKVPLKRTR